MAKRYKSTGKSAYVPAVSPVEIIGYDNNDNLVSFRLRGQDAADTAFENIEWGSERAPKIGDRYLCRIETRRKQAVKLSPIKYLPARDKAVFAVAHKRGKAWEFLPIEKSVKRAFSASAELDLGEVREGDLLALTVSGFRAVEVAENYGSAEGVSGINKLSLLQFGVDEAFPDAVLQAADACGSDADIGLQTADKADDEATREDLTAVPLVTIDGADAKDFDDAVYACAEGDGYRLLVAIADVGTYVAHDSPMDKEARRRGNSIYLPGMVVPMLPFALSAGLCSLKPDVARYALAVEMHIKPDGDISDFTFKRILMRSRARLIYEDVDAFLQGGDLDAAPEVVESLRALHGLYKVLARSRQMRGALEISGGDRKPELDEQGKVRKISILQQTESRKLIEEMMIAANVCAARFLMRHGLWAQHRNHESPPADKVEAFGDVVEALGYKFPRAAPTAKNFNAVARAAGERGEVQILEGLILRAQSQAYYAPKKKGHFGLGLQDYCHFTSPIRRYADLLVHRAIASRLGGAAWELGAMELMPMGEAISDTERQAMNIERGAMDRISALYLRQLLEAGSGARDGGWRSEGRGGEGEGGVSAKGEVRAVVRSVTEFALFVYIEDACADAILPFRSLPRDYYKMLDYGARLLGADSGLVLKLGDVLQVRVVEADPYAGKISVEYVSGGKHLSDKETGKLAGKHRRPSSHHRGKGKHGKGKFSRGKDSRGKGKPKPKFKR